MRLILDTHAALWWLANDSRFTAPAADAITAPDSQVLLSAVVTWEVAIKRSLGKLDAPDDLQEMLLGAGAVPLAISLDHTRLVETLPWHHRDPFDGLLAAQATSEDAAIVSGDECFSAYDVRVVW